MRPLGVKLIAAVHWLRGAAYAIGALALLGLLHLGTRFMSAIANDTFLQRLTTGLGNTLAIGLLLFALFWIVLGFGILGDEELGARAHARLRGDLVIVGPDETFALSNSLAHRARDRRPRDRRLSGPAGCEAIVYGSDARLGRADQGLQNSSKN